MDTEDMRDDTRTFAYSTGIIIVSRNISVLHDLEENNNFLEYRPIPPPLRVFYSTDLIKEIRASGIPKNIQKYLALSFFT
jgi:hypothetical protein